MIEGVLRSLTMGPHVMYLTNTNRTIYHALVKYPKDLCETITNGLRVCTDSRWSRSDSNRQLHTNEREHSNKRRDRLIAQSSRPWEAFVRVNQSEISPRVHCVKPTLPFAMTSSLLRLIALGEIPEVSREN